MTNPMTWLIRYIRDSKEEMAKVTWPSRAETTKYSVLVIVISIGVAAFFFGLDWALNLGLEQLIELSS